MPQGRTAAKLIRFAPDELAAVCGRARACGRTPARFIREAALGAIPKARHNQDRDRILLALARVGGQLSALARRTNDDDQGEAADAQLDAALTEHRTAIRALIESGLAPRSKV
jgi:DNA-binding FrmR family transcriptional regulator